MNRIRCQISASTITTVNSNTKNMQISIITAFKGTVNIIYLAPISILQITIIKTFTLACDVCLTSQVSRCRKALTNNWIFTTQAIWCTRFHHLRVRLLIRTLAVMFCFFNNLKNIGVNFEERNETIILAKYCKIVNK